MKKLIFSTGLILFLLASLSVSCKKDKTEEPYIGKWNVVSQSMTFYLNNVITSDTTVTFATGEAALEILNNGKGNLYDNGVITDTFTWEKDGDIFTMTVGSDTPIGFDLTVNGDTLTLTYTNQETSDSDVYKIVMSMVLKRD